MPCNRSPAPLVASLCLALVAFSPGVRAQNPCGDCNLDGVLSILDALAAASDAVSLVPLLPGAFGFCDVDTNGQVNVLDAFLMAYASVGGPVTLVCQGVDLDVDADRNGTVSAGASDEAGEDVWDTASGGAFMFNCDDDDGDSAFDYLNSSVDGATDALDLAPIVVRALPGLPPGATAELTVTTPAAMSRVRIFRQVSPGSWVQAHNPAAPAPYVFPAADLAMGDVTFGIEATTFRSPSWDGTANIQLRVLDGMALLGTDEVAMRASPVILQDNIQVGSRVHSVNITLAGQAPNQPYINAFETALTAAGVPWTWADQFAVSFDRWEQDNMQCGYTSIPAPGGAHAPFAFIEANRQGRGLFDYLEDYLVSSDLGMVWPGASMATSLNSHGNLEVVPPHNNGVTDYPLGRVIVGGGTAPGILGGPTINRHMDPLHRAFFDAQEIQGPHLEVSTEWLIVGHTDEMLGYYPDLATGGGAWKVGIADPDLAIANLMAVQASGQGSTTVFAGRAGWQTTVNGILADTSLMAFNAAAQVKMDSVRSFMMANVGLTAADFIDLPMLFEPYVSGGISYAVAYNPGVVNTQVVTLPGGMALMFVPDPEGPHVSGTDVWSETTENAMVNALGPVTIVFTDCFTSYHELLGEVHCGSNVERAPCALNWWNY